MICFTCQREGHIAADCTWKRELAPRHGTHLPPPVPPKRDPEPPTEDYLAARDALGIPSGDPGALALKCPWCQASPWQACVNPATGQDKKRPHDARYAAAKVPPPPDPAQAAIARQQAEESRRARLTA